MLGLACLAWFFLETGTKEITQEQSGQGQTGSSNLHYTYIMYIHVPPIPKYWWNAFLQTIIIVKTMKQSFRRGKTKADVDFPDRGQPPGYGHLLLFSTER